MFARTRDGTGGGGEFSFILIVDGNGFTKNSYGLDARHPIEVRVQQQLVVALQRGEVMAVGIPMALGIKMGTSCSLPAPLK